MQREHRDDADRSARARPAEPARPLDEREKDTVDRAAGPLGAASGAIAAGAAGTLILGPLGTAIGAVGGALGGWWAGSAMKQSVPYAPDDERYYREHFDGTHRVGRSWDAVSPAYHLGHLAAHNPDYHELPFDEVERDLRRIWNDDLRTKHGEWNDLRTYVRASYERERRRQGSEGAIPRPGVGTGATADLRASSGRKAPDLDMGGTRTHHRAEFSDPGPHDAHPEDGFFDRDVGASAPSGGDPESDRADGMGPMIDRGGFKPRDRDPNP